MTLYLIPKQGQKSSERERATDKMIACSAQHTGSFINFSFTVSLPRAVPVFSLECHWKPAKDPASGKTVKLTNVQ